MLFFHLFENTRYVQKRWSENTKDSLRSHCTKIRLSLTMTSSFTVFSIDSNGSTMTQQGHRQTTSTNGWMFSRPFHLLRNAAMTYIGLPPVYLLSSIKCITPTLHFERSIPRPLFYLPWNHAPTLSRSPGFSRRSHPFHPLDFSLSLFSSLFPGLRRPSFKAHGVFCFPSAGVTTNRFQEKKRFTE